MSIFKRAESIEIRAGLLSTAADVSKAQSPEEKQAALARHGVTDVPDEKVEAFVRHLRRQAARG